MEREGPKVVKLTEAESWTVIVRARGVMEGWVEDGELRLMGSEFQSGMLERLADGWWLWWPNNVNVLSATNCATKMAKMVSFMLHIFYHNFFLIAGRRKG